MRGVACIVVALALHIAWASESFARDFSRAADDLSGTLASDIHCDASDTVSVGIWPFDEADIPIGASNAYRVYATFLAELMRGKPECVAFFDGDGVSATIAYLNRVGVFREAGRKPLDQIEQNLRNVDYYVAGTLIEQAGDVFVIFKIVDSETGSTIAATGPLSVPQELIDRSCGDGAITIDAALDEIAKDIADRTPEMRHLIVEGGYFGNTSAKTEFSGYFETLMTGRIAQAYENVITGRALAVHNLSDGASRNLIKVRGLDVKPIDLDPRVYEVAERERSPNDSSAYLLTFRYWPCEKAAKLQVNLRNRAGDTASWMGNVRLDNLPEGMAFEPPTPTETKDWGPDGAFTFDMTSQRGINPRYEAGENFEALFRLERDAWVYCFYTDSSGDTTQVLPNPFQNESTDRNFYKGGKLHAFPDSRRIPEPDPFDLTINAETSGIEIFRCMATSRNVTNELPPALRGTSLDPIPVKYASRLREVFEGIEEASLSVSKMTVTVLE